jgi:hypothetical protein
VENAHENEGRRSSQELSTSLSPYLWPRIAMLDFGDAGTSNLLELARERVSLIQLCHVVAASYAFAYKQDVRHSSPARHVRQKSLELLAKRVNVQLDDVRLGLDAVFLEQDVFCFHRVWAVCLGEDDDCGMVSTCGKGKSRAVPYLDSA